MFDNFIVNLHKNKGFLTSIPCIPIPEYGQSNAALIGHCVMFIKIGCTLWPIASYEWDLILLCQMPNDFTHELGGGGRGGSGVNGLTTSTSTQKLHVYVPFNTSPPGSSCSKAN